MKLFWRTRRHDAFEARPRPRPRQLGQVFIGVDRMKRIEITSDDEEAIGLIFAWLLAQSVLAQEEDS